MMGHRLRGSMTALATPFRHGSVDEADFVGLVARQIAAGTTGLVVCGSTGEAASLSQAEHRRVVAAAVMAAAGRVPVYAGCGAPCTAQAVEIAVQASEAGADGLLVAPPPYVRPTQAGIEAHVRAVHAATCLPIMLYDVPGRSAVAIADDTVVALFEAGVITSLKDASGDTNRPARLRARCDGRLVQLCGEDAMIVAYLRMGGDGCVSVTANAAPVLCAALHAAWAAEDVAAVAEIDAMLAPLHAALFAESNPIPLKAALQALTLATDEVRLPLTRATAATREGVARALEKVKARGFAPGPHQSQRLWDASLSGGFDVVRLMSDVRR